MWLKSKYSRSTYNFVILIIKSIFLVRKIVPVSCRSSFLHNFICWILLIFNWVHIADKCWKLLKITKHFWKILRNVENCWWLLSSTYYWKMLSVDENDWALLIVQNCWGIDLNEIKYFRHMHYFLKFKSSN